MTKDQWISVKDKFPNYKIEVLVLDTAHKIWHAEYDCDDGRIGWWYDHGFELDDITHWMPLPEPPEHPVVWPIQELFRLWNRRHQI
jgi:hypothetical protein